MGRLCCRKVHPTRLVNPVPGGLSVMAFRFPDYFSNIAGGNPAGWVSGIRSSAPVGSYTYQEQCAAGVAGTYTFSGESGVDNCGVISVNGAPLVGTGISIGFATGACSPGDLSNFQTPTFVQHLTGEGH
jgi:hypothetical protein